MSTVTYRDCRGKFFDSLKICPGNHGSHGVSRLLISSPHIVSRPSRFDHSGLERTALVAGNLM